MTPEEAREIDEAAIRRRRQRYVELCGHKPDPDPPNSWQTPEERAHATFWRKVRTNARTGCWEWARSCGSSGYGSFSNPFTKKKQPAHRFAYETEVGPIPDGMIICHHCDNPKCVRPEHLFLGTAADNTADMIAKGRAPWQR